MVVGVGARVVFGLGLADVFFGGSTGLVAIGSRGAVGTVVGEGCGAGVPAACCSLVLLFGFGDGFAGLFVFVFGVAGGGTPGLIGLFDVLAAGGNDGLAVGWERRRKGSNVLGKATGMSVAWGAASTSGIATTSASTAGLVVSAASTTSSFLTAVVGGLAAVVYGAGFAVTESWGVVLAWLSSDYSYWSSFVGMGVLQSIDQTYLLRCQRRLRDVLHGLHAQRLHELHSVQSPRHHVGLSAELAYLLP